MDAEQRGWYIQLLAEAWESKPQATLPDDEPLLRKLADVNPTSPNLDSRWSFVLEQFKKKGAYLINVRLCGEKRRQDARRVQAAEAGSLGGRKRAQRMRAAKAAGDHTPAEWNEMLEYFGCCLNCGSKDGLQKDHIVPIYQGGSNAITNIQPLCQSCNAAKGPESKDLRLGRVTSERLALAWGLLRSGLKTGQATSQANSSPSSSSSSSSSTSSPSPRKRSPAKKQREDERAKHPALIAVREVKGRYPHGDLWDHVIDVVGDRPDVPKMRRCWIAWRSKNYSSENLGWLVDWYVNGIPPTNNGRMSNAEESLAAAERVAAKYDGRI